MKGLNQIAAKYTNNTPNIILPVPKNPTHNHPHYGLLNSIFNIKIWIQTLHYRVLPTLFEHICPILQYLLDTQYSCLVPRYLSCVLSCIFPCYCSCVLFPYLLCHEFILKMYSVYVVQWFWAEFHDGHECTIYSTYCRGITGGVPTEGGQVSTSTYNHSRKNSLSVSFDCKRQRKTDAERTVY